MDLSLLKNLSAARILVVGDVMLDRYWYGDSGRISPEAPVPVVKVSKFEDKAGGAANVAKNIARLDGKVGLLGLIGEDESGQILENILEGEKINSQLVSVCDLPTISKMRVISRHQQVVRLDLEETFNESHSQLLLNRLELVLNDYDFIVFSDYNKGSLSLIKEMISVAKKAGKTVLVDPKSSDLQLYRGADYITPNLNEFKLAGGQVGSEETLASSARNLISDAGITAMLLTRSEQGMSLINATEKYDFAAQELEVSDVTGAGDTVIATLAVMLGAGMMPKDAVEIANLAAGIAVSKLGAATVSPEELSRKLGQYLQATGEHYQTPFDDVLQHIEFAKQNGETIVFTNGCFDILHAGHVRYLAQAKARGDRLVVGLNNDESIARLKGPERPINPLDERAMVLSALASVDWVIPFGSADENDTPAKLIEQISPDILVKGGDYTVEQIAGAEHVLRHGGKVEVLEFLDGCSTSKVISKIKS
ncbi:MULTISPECIES: bifunctional D-glycero-beta-D-manno-heptose-7-phosphate kinase/D-glycero-beta-D-manno-heptose 1-phosphate adenylyltransferase HldE [unclassified Pseudoalteromonas]|jgi:D-beta-D-heptose 7-phosphate kinase/D-beta-D-heptose 1-phosphate adenosyltransferase|uniref:bifunctional D-glycero-beta-D-manno-heptose-7-phosphate kinase/D-glycero-beta-D-manno-heptose 1-phosphate adenylyltransferase HldE n=1 Tax=Pseudoalteromonas TaxID=53246 RepID=UPI00040CF5B1|nr:MULTISPECIES: bifunctional D-glycero-beta-D-manno-heptose-7-phosphate kinase/D-glycero-beta-D-manno-heptose 1-phosphate adenylyltransferase HldE [unclassified Pseudoalteromonas]TMO97210.1 bifunctional D-glycero-beta-D-manno-heptose-7-phosphate kinase/D-glycero-beta-D-manno-heptose 1-phosphate adenylyltransferase HldE [Pseudoalteromonas sp. S3260]TMP49928.1 bifunctional D-glycero-beta-D-manno-heptose-7-phosphate kinase/D-glycero-beta-D-manno-heptose 1-phosphate adenylyltransferase HldE [Pseudoa